MSEEVEIWKAIEGYEGKYEVSNFGRVKSLARPGGAIPRKEMQMRLRPMQRGYLYVALYDGRRNCKNKYIQRLVAEAFLGKSPLEVNHKDGNKKNNAVTNLEYVTHKRNLEHARDNGLLACLKGEKSHKATISDSRATAACEMLWLGATRDEIIETLGIKRSIVSQIQRHLTWKHIPREFPWPRTALQQTAAS